jgi:uncharacterized protein (TIGR03083 family)
MGPEHLQPFVLACELATGIIGDRRVAARWRDPSGLPGFSVGGVAAHMYAATRRFEVALDEPVAGEPIVLGVGEFYGLNRVDDPSDLQGGLHPLLREDAERRAGYGPAAVADRFTAVVGRLFDRLPNEPANRLVPVWTVAGGATPLTVYVATRVVELVVHADDLASSAGLEPLTVPPEAASTAIGVFVEMARHRSGDLAVVRAFARRERAGADTLRVL